MEYNRVSGYFTSSSLAVAAKGIAGLIKNGGHLHLVTSAMLQKRDIDAIIEGTTNLTDALELSLSSSLQELEDRISNNHLRAMGWMIREGLLEIRIAVMMSENGLPLEVDEVERKGMVHQKVGLFTDSEGNQIAFDGSINETASGWNLNLEQFKVFREWVPGEREFYADDEELFDSLWQNRAERAKIFPVPEAIRMKLVKTAPVSIDELDLKTVTKAPPTTIGGGSKVPLWDQQIRAIDEWFKHDCRGILSMATGTGKTIAALGCMTRLVDRNKRLLTVVSCPQLHLVTQWKNVIKSVGVRGTNVVCDSSNPHWKREVADQLVNLDIGVIDSLVLITTHTTLASQSFRDEVSRGKTTALLIVDEVHGAGTEIRNEGLTEGYVYRLGLSATPERPMDPEGTARILDYFGPVVFDFTIGDAIHTINPSTGKTFLVPYEYYPIEVQMTDDELREYQELSSKIAKAYYSAESDEKKREYFENLCYERARIVNSAQNKLMELNRLIDELQQSSAISHTVVYCEQPLCRQVQKILIDKNLRVRRFTQQEGVVKEDRFDGMSEREYILKGFAEGNPQVLTAIRCLDEGVDVPEMRASIIMASSTNPRQTIQRRGRLLRNAPGKTKATIYDMVVFPAGIDRLGGVLNELDLKILHREISRCRQFADDAMNRNHYYREFAEIEKQLKEYEDNES